MNGRPIKRTLRAPLFESSYAASRLDIGHDCIRDEPRTRMVQQSDRGECSESPRPGRVRAEGAQRRLRTCLTRCTFSYSPSLAG